MRALIYVGPGDLQWRDVAAPRPTGDGEAIVRPVAVATCDLDAMIVSGASPFPAPFALGHEGVAEVLEVGDGVRSVQPGDRVLVPFQISCGTCAACAAGRTGSCETVPGAPTYGFGFGDEATRWGGFLSDAIHVPYADAMLVAVPDGLAPELAAGASDNITDAHRSVAPPLAARPGAAVLVCGGAMSGSIGLYAVAHATTASIKAIRPLECIDPTTLARSGASGMLTSAQPPAARITLIPKAALAGIGSSSPAARDVRSITPLPTSSDVWPCERSVKSAAGADYLAGSAVAQADPLPHQRRWIRVSLSFAPGERPR